MSLIHQCSVIITLIYIPFGKLAHIPFRPMSVLARNYREHYAEQSMKECKVCGDKFVSTEQSNDVIEVLGVNEIEFQTKEGHHLLKCACHAAGNTGLRNSLGFRRTKLELRRPTRMQEDNYKNPRDTFFKEVENLKHPNETLVKTHCSYCGMQCGMNLRVNTVTNKIIGVEPRYDWPVTLGKMCPKGVTAYQQTNHDDRILRPLIRDDASLKGTKEGFREASWEEAYDLNREKIQELQTEYGKDSFSVFSGVSMTNEKCYLTGKFARVGLQTRYIDYNGRFCMSSAAGGFLRSFGVDRGSTLPWTDLHETDCLFIAGSNTAECHPTSMFRVWEVQERGGYIIVVDPRETPIARRADVHLDLRPGTDLGTCKWNFKLIDSKWSC